MTKIKCVVYCRTNNTQLIDTKMSAYFTAGADPELMIANAETGRIESSLDIFPDKGKLKKFDFGEGYSAYPDNVLIEGTLPPARSKEEFVHNYRSLFQKTDSLFDGKFKLKVKAFHVFKPTQLTHEEATLVGCSSEYCAWQLTEHKAELLDCGRSGGGHIHIGHEVLLDAWKQVEAIKLMDIFVGLPMSVIDCDPTSQSRKKLYGKMGRLRPTAYGVEYRTLSNFWIHSPETVRLVYDLTNHVIDVMVDDKAENYIAQTSEAELRRALDDGDTKLAQQVIKRIFPKTLITRVAATKLGWGKFYKNWGI